MSDSREYRMVYIAGFDYAETLVDSYTSSRIYRAELGPEPIYFHLSESVTVRMIILRHKTIYR